MNEARVSRERQVWIAAVAVLATSLAWLAAVSLVLILRGYGFDAAAALAVARALLRAGWLLAERSWPMLPLAAAAGLGIVLAVRSTGAHRGAAIPQRGGVRHG